MPLPTVQPPAAEAPTPIRMPPKTERTAWVADGRRRRNSPEALAAKNAPTSKPRTSSTPQSTVSSPLMRNLERLEDGLDAEAVVAASGGGQWPGDHAEHADDGCGWVEVPGLLREDMRQAGLLRLQGGHLRGSRLFGAEVAGQGGPPERGWGHRPPDGQHPGGG